MLKLAGSLATILAGSLFLGAQIPIRKPAAPVTRAAASPAVPGGLDYPLAPKTRWTYHVHKVIGAGVHFTDGDASLAKGDSIDLTVVSEVAGNDSIGGKGYARVETRQGGKPYMFEWFRIGPEGLLLGRTRDYNSGNEEVMLVPPQRVSTPHPRPGESWTWRASDAPVSLQAHVAGLTQVSVPAGDFHAVEIAYTLSAPASDGHLVQVQNRRWLVEGIGFVKTDTRMHEGNRFIFEIVMSLEKFEPGITAK